MQVVGESLLVKRHVEYFFWLQGEFQRFVPHEIFIGAWGDFAGGDIFLDVVSALPGVRTESLSSCPIAVTTACAAHHLVRGLFDRWRENDRHGFCLTASTGLSLAAPACHCPFMQQVRRMQSARIHGIHDKRGQYDCLYIALHSDGQVVPASQRAFGLLLPYVDAALRRIRHLPSQSPPPTGVVPAAGDVIPDLGLSDRETEIVQWVCQGKTNYEIGMILGISAFTVKNHLQRIFRKLDVCNRAQAVAKFEGKAVLLS